MKILFNTDINIEQRNVWSEFVLNHPNGNIFQTPEMFDFFDSVEFFEPLAFLCYDENDCLVGCLLAVVIREYNYIFRKFSSRTVIYGGPLIQHSNPKHRIIFQQLLEKMVLLSHKKCIFIQFRNFFELAEYRTIFFDLSFSFRDRLNFIVPITSREQVWNKISESKRRQIKQGLKAGAEIVEPANIGEVRDFYYLLENLYKNKVKKPLPHWSFFKFFHEASLQKKLGKILLVRYNGQIIGGILSPVFSNKVIYEWYVCGLDREFQHLHPSVLATWAPIDYALKNGIGSFDFMGVGIPTKNYGVRDFKMKFGGDIVNYGRFTRINNRLLYNFAEMFYNFLALIHKV